MYEELTAQAKQAVTELLDIAKLKPGKLFVIGCSSSEMVGARIGKGSSLEAAQAAFAGIYPVLQERGIELAVQCCEHLNRALVVERDVAEAHGFEIVNAIPQLHAGGSFAMTAWANFKDPVLVETIVADAGLDIGGTLIGMHPAPRRDPRSPVNQKDRRGQHPLRPHAPEIHRRRQSGLSGLVNMKSSSCRLQEELLTFAGDLQKSSANSGARFCGVLLDFPVLIQNSLFIMTGTCYNKINRCGRSMDLQRSEAYEKITLGRDRSRRHCGSQDDPRHDAGRKRGADRRHGQQCRAG